MILWGSGKLTWDVGRPLIIMWRSGKLTWDEGKPLMILWSSGKLTWDEGKPLMILWSSQLKPLVFWWVPSTRGIYQTGGPGNEFDLLGFLKINLDKKVNIYWRITPQRRRGELWRFKEKENLDITVFSFFIPFKRRFIYFPRNYFIIFQNFAKKPENIPNVYWRENPFLMREKGGGSSTINFPPEPTIYTILPTVQAIIILGQRALNPWYFSNSDNRLTVLSTGWPRYFKLKNQVWTRILI